MYFKNISFIIICKEKKKCGASKNKSIYLRKFNRYGQRRSIMSLVWYMRVSIWNFGYLDCTLTLFWY